jgi:hypothetical protein
MANATPKALARRNCVQAYAAKSDGNREVIGASCVQRCHVTESAARTPGAQSRFTGQ